MYLSKQWRESRIISILAILGLALLLALVVKGATAIDTVHFDNRNYNSDFGGAFIPLFYVEAALIGFWGWLAAGIGIGKNLGEDSGSFLLTRPHRRAWFLWSDWGYAMAQVTAIIVLTNLMIGLLMAHILHLMHLPAIVPLADGGATVSLFVMMVLVSVGVLLFAGLIYGVSYFCTVLIQRTSGVMLGAGIFVLYLVLGGLVHHYYPAIHFPNLIVGPFHIEHHGAQAMFRGPSINLVPNIIIRAVIMVAFPVAAQLLLERSEI